MDWATLRRTENILGRSVKSKWSILLHKWVEDIIVGSMQREDCALGSSDDTRVNDVDTRINGVDTRVNSGTEVD